jgi:hypothetical protein
MLTQISKERLEQLMAEAERLELEELELEELLKNTPVEEGDDEFFCSIE